MSGKSFVYNNTYVRKINGLYLNSETSDVNFVFDIDTDQPEKVPAHKAILSLGNQAFHAMFYGPIKEIGDVPIADVCAAAFKEFLQFFYLDEVRLTTENIVQVINLCKMYEMDECMKACETTLQKSLTIDDMCHGYSIALLLEQKNLIEFCEQKIKTNAQGILKSESFLESGRSLLKKILTLVSSNWSAMEMVIACMEWAKAECNRNNLDTSAGNLRTQIGDLFSKIPFEELSLEQFSQYVVTYKGFFDLEENTAIIQKILSQNQQSKSFDLQLLADNRPNSTLMQCRILDCDRRAPGTFTFYRFAHSITQFKSNKKLLLTKFYVPRLNGSQIKYSVYKLGDDCVSKKLPLENECIELPKPLIIEAETLYIIYISNLDALYVPNLNSNEDFQFEGDIYVKFVLNKLFNDLVSRLIFKIPENLF